MYNFSTNSPIILASTSPRRRELLEQVAVPYTCLSINIDETQLSGESAVDYIQRMVSQKAESALQVLPNHLTDCVVITADTIGVLSDGTVLQKPIDFADACTMWQRMSDNDHQVWTAVQVSRMSRQAVKSQTQSWRIESFKQTVVKTEVSFIELNDSMMRRYWQTGEPQDKAGGYAIQGQGVAWVKSIHGSYSNVVGLPLVETLELLQRVTQSQT